MIHVLPDVLTRDAAKAARERLTALPESDWADGRDSAGSQAKLVKDNLQLPHEHAVATSIRQAVLAGLERSAEFFSAALPLKVFTPRINCYTPKFPHYGLHVDSAVRMRMDGERVRTDLSCTLFLNDPDEYEGGELVIQNAGTNHRFKLPAGSAVLYPSYTVHEVTPVTRGHRLACFFWVESMVRSSEQRSILFELDKNLIQLRSAIGETSETTSLTGVYHNLLRQWVST
jgi:PKHD-type hydroxylase